MDINWFWLLYSPYDQHLKEEQISPSVPLDKSLEYSSGRHQTYPQFKVTVDVPATLFWGFSQSFSFKDEKPHKLLLKALTETQPLFSIRDTEMSADILKGRVGRLFAIFHEIKTTLWINFINFCMPVCAGWHSGDFISQSSESRDSCSGGTQLHCRSMC